MIKLVAKYKTAEEKEVFIEDISRLRNYKILKVTKEYPGKGKSPYKKTYIDLDNK